MRLGPSNMTCKAETRFRSGTYCQRHRGFPYNYLPREHLLHDRFCAVRCTLSRRGDAVSFVATLKLYRMAFEESAGKTWSHQGRHTLLC